MKKILSVSLLITVNFCFSQFSKLEIVTKKNDTIRNISIKDQDIGDPRTKYKFQNELVYVNNQREVFTVKPSEVISFSFMYGDDVVKYESREDKIFALVMYNNRIKLLRFQRPAYTPVDIYVIERPSGKRSFLEAMGLSRRISLKVIKREMSDCPTTITKVKDDILKVHGEPGVLELVKDYETSCY